MIKMSSLALVSVILASQLLVKFVSPCNAEDNVWRLEATGPPPCLCSCSNDSLTCSELSTDSCPPGLFCKEGHCECGVYPDNIVSCNGTRAFIITHNCASYEKKRNLTLVGRCGRPFSRADKTKDHLFEPLPAKVQQLNNFSCKLLNRTGVMCGRCLPDHYPLAYSYDMKCVPCPNARMNWLWYIMAAYLPLTVFYIIILFFRINATSGHLFALVFYCQALSLPLILRSIFVELPDDFSTPLFLFAKALVSFNGVWNLDFFRPFYSNLCLGIGILPTLALDYVIAVYPLFLIAITYLLINLHDRNYRASTFIFKPCKAVLSLFQNNWDIKTSVIDAFATFFLLSNVKFFSVSFDLLLPMQVFQLYPDHYNYTLTLLYAGDVEYFSKEHLPYAILAIVVMCVFVLLPATILTLYPFSFFHKFINLFPGRWHVLHTFVDAFYGSYKDGTQPGIRDYRWWASVLFIFRTLQFLLYLIESKLLYNIVLSIGLLLYTTLLAILQPYKSTVPFLNATHLLFFNMLSIFSVSIIGVTVAPIIGPRYVILFYAAGALCGVFAPLYLVCRGCYWVYQRKRFAIVRLKAWRLGYSQLREIS